MKAIPLAEYPASTLEGLLSGIPFYKDLLFHDPDQLDVLKAHSKIFEPPRRANGATPSPWL